MSVGKKLSKKIKDNGWTVVHVAEKSGVPLPTIKGIIYGFSKGSMKTFEKLADALNCTIDELIKDNHQPQENKDRELFEKCSKSFEKYVEEKNLKFSYDFSNKVVQKLISLYSKKKKEGQDIEIDNATIEWIVESLYGF